MDLKDQDIGHLGEEVRSVVKALRKQGYQWPGKEVYQKVFLGIVGHHYERHWEQEDLRIVRRPRGQVRTSFNSGRRSEVAFSCLIFGTADDVRVDSSEVA